MVWTPLKNVSQTAKNELPPLSHSSFGRLNFQRYHIYYTTSGIVSPLKKETSNRQISSRWTPVRVDFEVGMSCGYDLGPDKTLKVKKQVPFIKQMNRLLTHYEPGHTHAPKYEEFSWGESVIDTCSPKILGRAINHLNAPGDWVALTAAQWSFKCKAANEAMQLSIHQTPPPKKKQLETENKSLDKQIPLTQTSWFIYS